MSQAEELLSAMSEEIPVHTHPVPDTDTYFVIDPITRQIENTNRKKHVIMQYDHNSERCTFELPRYIDGHDMLECTSVTVNVNNIEVVESDGVEEAEPVEPRINSDAPDMTDLRIHPNDPEKVISSWLISRNSTQLAGILSFHIEYKCVDSNGNVVYEWSTDNYDEYEIRARKKNGEAAIAPHIDTLEQWRTRIFGAGDSVMANIAAEGEAQVAAVKAESETQQEAVELKGAQTLDSIPEDYTKVDAMADEAVRSKGDAIVCEAAGEVITVKDASDSHIRGLKLFGKSTQDGTPTPDNPIDIDSVNVRSVVIGGINLLKVTATTTTVNGVTFTVNLDGTVVANGTASEDTMFEVSQHVPDILPNVKYYLYGCPSGAGYAKYYLRVTDKLTYAHDDYGSGILFSYPDVSKLTVSIQISGGMTVSNLVFRPMLCAELYKNHAFEAYKPAQHVALNHTLPGIPVISGGNYTDENGQQWICDEVDLERGVYVQRVAMVTIDDTYTAMVDVYPSNSDKHVFRYRGYNNPQMLHGGTIYHNSGYCNLFEYNDAPVFGNTKDCCAVVYGDAMAIRCDSFAGDVNRFAEWAIANALTIQYVLGTPLETPLTAEEITVFKALRTNYPNTTILNDAGAWMSVKYNADTKTYVENPKTLKLVDSSTGVVYELKVVDGSLTVVPVQ